MIQAWFDDLRFDRCVLAFDGSVVDPLEQLQPVIDAIAAAG